MYAVARAVTGHGGANSQAPHHRVIYTESHDEVANGRARVPETIYPGRADSLAARTRAALGLVLTLTSPGIPMLFQGQDFLEDRWFADDAALDWQKAHRHAGFLHLTRLLIGLRRNATGRTAGLSGPHTALIRVDNHANVLAFHRWSRGGPGDDTVVVINLRSTAVHNYPLGLPRAGRWNLRCNTDAPFFGPGLGTVHSADVETTGHECDGYPYRAHVTVGPYAALIYSQDR